MASLFNSLDNTVVEIIQGHATPKLKSIQFQIQMLKYSNQFIKHLTDSVRRAIQ